MPKSALSIIPANEASFDDLKAIFGTRGEAAGCFCQRYKLKPKEAFKHWPAEVRVERLRIQDELRDPAPARLSLAPMKPPPRFPVSL